MSCKKNFSSSSPSKREKFDLDGNIFHNSKINRMDLNVFDQGRKPGQ